MLGATEVIHNRLATTEPEQQAGIWLMDEEEAAGVADPLASIAGRRTGGTLVNADMSDLIAAGVAAAAYLMNNTIRAFKIRRAVRRAGLHVEPEEHAA